MRILLLLIFLIAPLFSITITANNIYKQSDSLDLMLTFDEPYLGKISKISSSFGKILTLDAIKIEQNKKLTIDSDIAQKIEIVTVQNETRVKIYAQDSFTINASKTIDNYGLRIRVKPENLIQPIKEKKYETKANYDMTSSFLKVIAILALLLFVLYALKKWLTAPKSEGWLFNKSQTDIKEIKVITQKVLDTRNRVCVIEYEGMEYLTVLGSSNILLDKKPKDQNSKFDQEFNKSTDQLVSILKNK